MVVCFLQPHQGPFSCSSADLWVCTQHLHSMKSLEFPEDSHRDHNYLGSKLPLSSFKQIRVFLPSKQWFLRLIAAIILHLVSKETTYPSLSSIPPNSSSLSFFFVFKLRMCHSNLLLLLKFQFRHQFLGNYSFPSDLLLNVLDAFLQNSRAS